MLARVELVQHKPAITQANMVLYMTILARMNDHRQVDVSLDNRSPNVPGSGIVTHGGRQGGDSHAKPCRPAFMKASQMTTDLKNNLNNSGRLDEQHR